MIIKIAIADKNLDYLKRLVSELEKYQGLNLFAFSDEESLSEAWDTRKFDVFVFSPDVYTHETEYSRVRANLKILLDDREVRSADSFLDAKCIEKYQRVSRIYKRILELYSECCGRGMEPGETDTALVSYFSPVGGAGKTTIALMTASKLAKQGKKTFYISLEDIASEDCYLPQSEEKGLSDLMRYLGTDTNIPMKLQGMMNCKMGSLYYLNHFSSPNDVYDMDEEDLEALLDTVRNAGLFDVVIIDMGTALSAKNRVVFDKSDRIVVVERTDALSARKMNCFFSQSHIMNDYGEKMLRIINFDNGIEVKNEGIVPIVGKIGFVNDMEADQVITVLAESQRTQFALSAI